MSLENSKEQLLELDQVIEQHKGQKGALMPVLQAAQSIYGYCPYEAQVRIAQGLGITLSEVYGVATFYSQFTLEKQGRFSIGVCLGTACYVKGGQKIIDRIAQELKLPIGKTDEEGKFTLIATRCLGACGLAPVLMINDEVYGRLTPDDVPTILAKYADQ